MAKEINTQQTGLSGAALYATLDRAGQRWNGTAFENILLADWASYAVAMPEAPGTGYFSADVPAAGAGLLTVTAYKRVGGSPAATDPVVASGRVDWTGTAEASSVTPVALSSASVTALVNGVWDEPTSPHGVPGSFGSYLGTDDAIDSGQAQAGTANTVTLRNGATPAALAGNSFVAITAGTGKGQQARVTAYDRSNPALPVATVDANWLIAPDNTSWYAVVWSSEYRSDLTPAALAAVKNGVWDEPKSGHTVAGSFGANLDAAVSTRLASASYVVPPSPSAIDTQLSGTHGAGVWGGGSGGGGSFTPAQVAAAVWTDVADLTTPGTPGYLIAQNLDAKVSTRSTYAGGPVASVAAPVTVGTNNDKAGYGLAPTGLDSIATAPPSGGAVTFPQFVVMLYRRFFKKSTLTASQLKTYGDDGVTVLTTQAVTDDGVTQTQGVAS